MTEVNTCSIGPKRVCRLTSPKQKFTIEVCLRERESVVWSMWCGGGSGGGVCMCMRASQ